MGNRPVKKAFVFLGWLALAAMLLAWPVAPSSAGSLQQTATAVRPTLTPSGGVTPAPPAASVAENPSLSGYVWTNGDPLRPAAGVAVRFTGDGFELATLTDANGYYQFETLGQDIGWLNVAGDGTPWKASVSDVALSPRPGLALRVNFSASRSSPARGPALVSVSSAPGVVGAGQTVTITIKASNTTGQKLSSVWITHLLPDGLAATGLTTDRGDALSYGQLAMANVGDMSPGDKATFVIVATAPNDGGPQGTHPIVASFVSSEGVAVQASTTLKGMGGPTILPVTGSGEWLVWIGLALAALIIVVHRIRQRRAPVF
ncbi:MAG TPA: LPXTG cell wall anchor domain-containing protein [Anaerolineae bacterium]